MKFLYPNFLWAFSLIVIPIIIHLFRFRRFKKIYFSNTALLSSIILEKQNRNKIKNLILLAIRILIITLLVFAFAQPYFPGKFSMKGKKTVCIYIDNSPSMENINSNGILLDQARLLAKKIIEGHGMNDEFQIVTNEFSFKEQLFYTREDALQLLNEISIHPLMKKLSYVVGKINNNFECKRNPQKIVYLISDFQQSTADLKKVVFNTDVQYYLLPVAPTSVSNLYIDSCWFSSPYVYPGQMVSLFVQVKNSGDKIIEDKSIRLNLNGLKKVVSFTLQGNEKQTLEIPFMVNQKGWIKGKLELDDYPVSFDDNYFFSYYVKEKIKVLDIDNQRNNALRTVYSTDNYFEFTYADEGSVNLQNTSPYDLIILNQPQNLSDEFLLQLSNFVMEGGSLLLIPPKELNNNWHNAVKRFGISPFENKISAGLRISGINDQHPFFTGIFDKKPKNIDFPSISMAYSRSSNYLNTEYSLIEFENGKPLLTLSNYGKGNIYTLSVSLDQSWSNLTRHSIFVPLMYQMALFRTHKTPLSYILGTDRYAEISGNSLNEKIKVSNGEKIFTPVSLLVRNNLIIQLDNNFSHDGFYEVNTDNKSLIACNYNRSESNLVCYSAKELKGYLSKNISLLPDSEVRLSKSIQQENNGKPLWQILIWLIIMLIAAEVLITRFYKIV